MEFYEKINKAVIACSAIQTIRGNSQENSSSALPQITIDFHNKPDSSKHHKSAEPKNGDTDDGVLMINFDYSGQTPTSEKPKPLESNQKKTQVSKVSFKIEPESKVGSPQFNTQEGKNLQVRVEDSVSDYINRVKIRMRTKSIVGTGSGSNVSDGKSPSGKDEFSEYIDRAGIKIRSTSSKTGGGRF